MLVIIILLQKLRLNIFLVFRFLFIENDDSCLGLIYCSVFSAEIELNNGIQFPMQEKNSCALQCNAVS